MHDSEEFERMPFGVVNDYTNRFHHMKDDECTQEINSLAEQNYVPIASANVASLLSTLIAMHRPKCVLELGTAYGVSTRHMLEALPEDGKLISLDLTCERQQVAQKYLKDSGISKDKFVLICEDFRKEGVLSELYEKYGSFDFVFIDAAKAQYATVLETLEPMLSEKAVVAFDNVFLNGWIISGHYPNHRQKTMFTRMNEFLRDVSLNKNYFSTLIPFDDGCLVMVKK